PVFGIVKDTRPKQISQFVSGLQCATVEVGSHHLLSNTFAIRKPPHFTYQIGLLNWRFSMIFSKNHISVIYHFLHTFWRWKSPAAWGDFARLPCDWMYNIISWATASWPRNIMVTPDTIFINFIISCVFFCGVVFR